MAAGETAIGVFCKAPLKVSNGVSAGADVDTLDNMANLMGELRVA